MASLEALVEVVPWIGGTLVEEPSAGILLVDLVQLVVPLDLALAAEGLLHDMLTVAAASLAVPFLDDEVVAEAPPIGELLEEALLFEML